MMEGGRRTAALGKIGHHDVVGRTEAMALLTSQEHRGERLLLKVMCAFALQHLAAPVLEPIPVDGIRPKTADADIDARRRFSAREFTHQAGRIAVRADAFDEGARTV